ncbi:MAG: homogentisate 1,2-dioxygenase, partial [Bdellovibrionales bacterium]|nr:homogentisate 1,2-dioxygenase [Bdellovibrionales bacterium]
MGTRGFAGIQSILYHIHQPTSLLKTELISSEEVQFLRDQPLHPIHLRSINLQTLGDPIESRVWLLGNSDIKIGISTPTEPMLYSYRNGLADELFFVHEGQGELLSQFGKLPFSAGDYVVIPVGTTYSITCSGECRFLVVESPGRIETPRRYRNEHGQLLEHSPFCERDIRVPDSLLTYDQVGEFEVRVRLGHRYTRTILSHHPFDVVGWDGYLYPWAFNIKDFEPITGRVHQPPPVHQTFASDGYVICSFVPRLYDYHPEAIPAPYNHSNVNSDE